MAKNNRLTVTVSDRLENRLDEVVEQTGLCKSEIVRMGLHNEIQHLKEVVE